MSVKDPSNHPQFKSVVSPREVRNEVSIIDEELDFADTSKFNRNRKNELASDPFETMVKQIVCAFVHQTSWVEGCEIFIRPRRYG